MKKSFMIYLMSLLAVSLLLSGCSDDDDDAAKATGPGGFYWYLGEKNQSCDEVCASRGGYNEVTKTFAGSVADGDFSNQSNCLAVLEYLGAGDGSVDVNQGPEATGCFLRILQDGRYMSPEVTTSSASGGLNEARACACNE